MSEPVILSASVMAPGEGPPITDGGVVVHDGRITAVGALDELKRQFPAAARTHFAGALLLPGFVNAHTHLELSYLRGLLPPGHFVDWVKRLIAETLARRERMPEVVAEAVRAGMAESLRYGVTLVGDISRQIEDSRAGLREGPLRAVSFGEVAALGARRGRLGEVLARACDRRRESETMHVGVSPHAPYTVEGPALQQVVAAARADGLPLAMHLAELAEEGEFLATLHGRVREAWDVAGTADDILDAAIPRFEGGPVRWARRYGLLPPGGLGVPVALAHVNYATDAELDIIAQAGASVVYCPRARAFFGHEATGPHRFADMLARGINVCLGTDSLASNPDLSVLAEARFLHRRHPAFPPATLLEMITIRGARALGMERQTGSLAPGKLADCVAVEVPDASSGPAALQALFAGDAHPTAVYLGGTRLA